MLSEKKITELSESVQILNKHLERTISLKMVFLRGIVNGIAYAIGATIVAGLVVTILWHFLQSVETLPFFNKLIDLEAIQEALEPL